jgi:hypothetical protein
MGKDPAVLFYTADFLAGTMFMRNEQVGKYIKLLCMQHQQGHLREEDMLEMCGSYDERIFSKFVKDEQGLYYNERMEEETEKRRRYSESRSNNRKKKKNEDMNADVSNTSKTYVSHMENENENINEDRNINVKKVIKKTKKTFIPPTFEEVLAYAIEKNREDLAQNFFDYFDAGDWVDSKGQKVRSWKQKFLTWANNTPITAKPKTETERFFEELQRYREGN